MWWVERRAQVGVRVGEGEGVVWVAVWWVRVEWPWQVCDVDARQGWKRSGLDWLARGTSPRQSWLN